MRATSATRRAVTVVAHDVGGPGGMEVQLETLIRGLLARGIAVTVVARRCDVEAHPLLRSVRVPGPARPFALAYPWFLLAGTLLTWRHRQGVLHTTGAIVLNRAHVSTVHLCHNGPGGEVSRPSRVRLAYRVNAWLARRLSRFTERLVFRPSRTRALAAVSRGLAEELVDAYPEFRGAVATVTNGVDARLFRPDRLRRATIRSRLGLGDDDFAALFVGSEWEGKGLAFALGAVANVAGAHLIVVGRGDVDRYRALAGDRGCAGRVHFVGPVRRPAPYYAAADAFVLPSAYETFSLALHEAAASGLPLVSTPVSGANELVVDGVNGWLVPRSVQAFVTRLLVLKGDKALRREMGAAARAGVERFTWDAMVDGYVEFYESVLGDAATAPAATRSAVTTEAVASSEAL